MIRGRKENIPLIGLPVEFAFKETRETFPFLLSILIKTLEELNVVKVLPSFKILARNKKIIEKKRFFLK